MKRYDFRKYRDENGKEVVDVSTQSRRKLDLFPRIICIVMALIIWIYCVNINEEDVVTTFNVKLNIVGAESMENGMSIYSTSNITEVKLTVQGSNRDINKFSASDYEAYIDVSKIDKVGWSNVDIITKIPEDSSVSILSMDYNIVPVFADVSDEKTVVLEIKEGNIIRNPSYLFQYKLEGADVIDGKSYINIKGPQTLIETITRAEYLLEGEFMTSKEISGFPLSFYNANGEVINASNSNNVGSSMITYDTTSMKVNVDVLTTKPVNIKLSGDVLSQYDCVAEPSVITVIGDPKVIENISEYILTLESDRTEYTITSEEVMASIGVALEKDTEIITVVMTEKQPVVDNE